MLMVSFLFFYPEHSFLEVKLIIVKVSAMNENYQIVFKECNLQEGKVSHGYPVKKA